MPPPVSADSLGWMISLVAFPLGSVAAGPLSDAVGVGATLVGAALLMGVGLVGALAVRDFRELRRLDVERQQPRPKPSRERGRVAGNRRVPPLGVFAWKEPPQGGSVVPRSGAPLAG